VTVRHAPRRSAARAAGLALALVLLGTAAAAVTAATARAATATPSPCGRPVPAPRYRHVVWIVMENHGYSSVVGSAAAPYLASLGSECGLATYYRAVAHPSLPNYLALTSGTTDGIVDDGEPSAHHVATTNLFSQLKGDWRALEESMPGACDKVTSGSYAARHDPAAYYTDLASTCSRDDLPLRAPPPLSAAFTFVTPNICDDMHDCPVATGDAWLARFVPGLLASSEYRSGEMVLFITWDESDTGPANEVATFVVAPSVPRGTRAATPFTHYSLLRTTEQLLGLPLLGAARTATSMLRAFGL